MLSIRKSNDRGHAQHGWLESYHTFSFANYYDPKHMGFSDLRVINEDRIDGGTGFGAHPHQDMEIISYVMSGSLSHQDSMGNQVVIKPGEVQRMSAGTGVVHSEKNDSPAQKAHFFQIWIMPEKASVAPGYGQKDFSQELASKNKVLVVSKEGRDNSIAINQDADLYISRLKPNEEISHEIRGSRKVWIQVVKGSLSVNGKEIEGGDGVAVEKESNLLIHSKNDSEILLFDLKE
jgi:quercetin 2,3-dioxygenase